jgi:Mrp family chromosome partitioning ATPase
VGEITEALRRARERGHALEAPRTGPEPREIDFPPPASQEAPAAPLRPPVALSLDREPEWPARAVVVEPRGPVAEALRHLALRIRADLDRRRTRSVAITSPLRGEGKSTLSCDLALALASLCRDRSVAIVDLDLRRPSIARDLRLRPQLGIEDYLRGGARLESVCVQLERPTLDVYPARQPQEAAHELLVSPQTAVMVRELERRYATVIYDTPPSVLVPDTRILLGHVAACVLVARHGTTRRRALEAMLKLLPRERLLGAVLNGGPEPAHSRQYGYYTEDRAPLGEANAHG